MLIDRELPLHGCVLDRNCAAAIGASGVRRYVAKKKQPTNKQRAAKSQPTDPSWVGEAYKKRQRAKSDKKRQPTRRLKKAAKERGEAKAKLQAKEKPDAPSVAKPQSLIEAFCEPDGRLFLLAQIFQRAEQVEDPEPRLRIQLRAVATANQLAEARDLDREIERLEKLLERDEAMLDADRGGETLAEETDPPTGEDLH